MGLDTKRGEGGGTAFIKLLGMSAIAGLLLYGARQDRMLMYYFLYEVIEFPITVPVLLSWHLPSYHTDLADSEMD